MRDDQRYALGTETPSPGSRAFSIAPPHGSDNPGPAAVPFEDEAVALLGVTASIAECQCERTPVAVP
jgi:hypothetical protein